MKLKKVVATTLATALVCTMLPATAFAANGDVAAVDAKVTINGTEYTYVPTDYNSDGVIDAYVLNGVTYCENITVPKYQKMNIHIPAAYVNADGSLNKTAEINGYTAETAPIIIRNSCSGWMSSNPDTDTQGGIRVAGEACTKAGYVYVSCGARSRDKNGDTYIDGVAYGKAPAPIVDLKAGVITLRANDDVLAGDTERIISVGGSGAGEMSSVLGATGNMEEYYPYLFEAGVPGLSKNSDGTYESKYRDDIYGCMAYYPIADIENADLAYAWMRVNEGVDYAMADVPGTRDKYRIDFTEFQMELQKDMAQAFCAYIDGLNLVIDGKKLTFDKKADGTWDVRSGSYYDAILNNMSVALNAYLDDLTKTDAAAAKAYAEALLTTNTDELTWIEKQTDGTYKVVDIDGFIKNAGSSTMATVGQLFERNKNIPSFDLLDLSGENNAFGSSTEKAVHYSASVADVLKENKTKYDAIMTDTEKEQVEAYIAQAYDAEVAKQTYLMNATHIMWDVATGDNDADVAPQWRIRSGTADQHTSFSIGYNMALAAGEVDGVECDYSLVWAMIHGAEREGTSTGTFLEWVEEICAETNDSNTGSGTTPDDGTTTPGGDGQKPETGTTSPETGDVTTFPIVMVLVAIGAVVAASARRRIIF